jgi:hypothetical protein
MASVADAFAQGAAVTNPCAQPESSQFDFWVGDWDLEWPAGQGGTSADKPGRGRNTITRILGGCVIQESFVSPSNDFHGLSHSVYNPNTKKWNQTWVDDQGSYIALDGQFADGKMELRTAPRTGPQGKTVINRMVFFNITKDSFDWSWQSSLDGGTTWKDLWNIQDLRMTDDG